MEMERLGEPNLMPLTNNDLCNESSVQHPSMVPISVTWASVIMWHTDRNFWTPGPSSHLCSFDPAKNTQVF